MTDSAMYPELSFRHTMREISVNRDDPCELVRELISNAYDAGATKIIVAPYQQHHGLVFFDNGCGLSQDEKDRRYGILPYVAFFSIGKTTKPKGAAIGYKCQGSKLCFAAARVCVISRCEGESEWRYKVMENPRSVLCETYDLTPSVAPDLKELLETTVFTNPDHRTSELLAAITKELDASDCATGTLLVLENYDVADYDRFFSVGSDHNYSYLPNYIRYYTAHGDTRRLDFPNSGFCNVDVNAVGSHLSRTSAAELLLWGETEDGEMGFRPVTGHWPYLPVTEDLSDVASPAQVSRLRDGRFFARYATAFRYEGDTYSLVLAVDGRRRCLDGYVELGRQRNARCGISLSSQRGVFISSHGVKICSYNQLFSEPLFTAFEAMGWNTENYVFFIDGPFDLVTNRNALAPESQSLLKKEGLLRRVVEFLEHARTQHSHRQVFREFIEVLNHERTHSREEHYQRMMRNVREGLPSRAQFQVTNVERLADKWFFEPAQGEEHFVGALYTLFSHLVPAGHATLPYWKRALTFQAFGIDAISCGDEAHFADSLEYLEYKHWFSCDTEFNHPFSITSTIVCWDFTEPTDGARVEDSYDYVGSVGSAIMADGDRRLGFHIGDIRKTGGMTAIGRDIAVVSLKRLLGATFDMQWRAART